MQQLGKYTVIRRLGAGGMAEVFLCKLVGIGGFEKHVVLKKIRADIATDEEFVTMFFDEARLAANLNHPSIIQVFEVDQLGGTPYIAMEYVRGATLAALLQKERASHSTPDFGHLAFIFAGVCAGLDHAHNARDPAGRALKIVHRDISPQNIMVSIDGTPKIFDFGVAKARGSLSLTGADRVKGKFAYMAPEQLRAQPVDAKADIYAVGVCMYEAVTGKRPFTAGTEAELFAVRMEGRFRMPSELVPAIPVELEHMILSAMAPDPADRPDAVELQAQLAAFCGAGSKHASSAHAVAAWLKRMLGEDTEAYESYASSSPSMTPLPRSANHPPTTNAVEAHRRKGKVNGVIAMLSLAAIGLTVALIMIVLRKQQRPEPAPSAEATALPPEPAPPPNHDESIRAFLDQARRHIDDKKLGLAEEMLDRAAALESHDAELAIERTELRHRVDVERTRLLAHEALDAKDWPRATELATQLLADAPDDGDAKHVLAEAKRGQERIAVAAPPPTTDYTVKERETKKKVVAPKPVVPTKPVVTTKAGSASPPPQPAGSGSSQVAAQVPAPAPAPVSPPPAGSAAPPKSTGSAAPPPKAITAVPAPPAAQIANPGSLDAVPSFSKVAVDGSLTTTEVQSALARTIDALRGCYRGVAKKANQTPEVSVKISFVIDEGARAGSVRISADTFGLAGCVKDAIGTVRTRVAPDVGTVSVSAVVRFKPTR